MMKCKSCGYSLQIEDKICPSCGAENPFFKEHREDMERYSEAFKGTQSAVIDRTRKTTGVLIKLLISLVLLIASIVIILMSGNSSLREKRQIRKVQAKIESYRAQYEELEKSNDYIALKEWYGVNHINRVPEFSDCLNVYNVCENYEFLAGYLAEISYEDYLENNVKYGFRDSENYCESIVSCYSMMKSYATKEIEASAKNEGHINCVSACLDQTKVLIQATFKLSDEQMQEFDELSDIQRTTMLMENWPYEE